MMRGLRRLRTSSTVSVKRGCSKEAGTVGNIENKLRRIKRQLSGPMVSIPQLDGSVARFPRADLAEAYIVALQRTKGEPVDHALCRAARNSSADHWRLGIYAEEPIEDLEDLSE